MLADAIGVGNKRRLGIQDRRLSLLRRRSASLRDGLVFPKRGLPLIQNSSIGADVIRFSK
jgi:hypothetical protein